MASGKKVFSGYLGKDDGFNEEESFSGPPNWKVNKSKQTEIYKVIHNLNLKRPKKQLHVVVQVVDTVLTTQIMLEKDSFTITTTHTGGQGSTPADLMFIAVYYPDK